MDEPFTPLLECAVTLHEMYKNFVEAGFTESQAMFLIGIWFNEAISRST